MTGRAEWTAVGRQWSWEERVGCDGPDCSGAELRMRRTSSGTGQWDGHRKEEVQNGWVLEGPRKRNKQGRRQDLGLGGGSSSNVLSTSSHFTAGGGPRKFAKGAHMVRYEFCHPNMSSGLGSLAASHTEFGGPAPPKSKRQKFHKGDPYDFGQNLAILSPAPSKMLRFCGRPPPTQRLRRHWLGYKVLVLFVRIISRKARKKLAFY